MWVTFRHQNPADLVTEQYPMERPDISDRFRGQPRLAKDENGKTLCTACGACALACPEKLIKVGSLRDPETKKKVLTEFDFDLSRCMFCGLCEEACPTNALKLSPGVRTGALYPRRNATGPTTTGAGNSGKGLREMTPVATPFFFYFSPHCNHQRARHDHKGQSRAFGAGADRNPAGQRRTLPDALCAVHGCRSDRALRRRHSRHVPVRDDAGEHRGSLHGKDVEQAVESWTGGNRHARAADAGWLVRGAKTLPQHIVDLPEQNNVQQIGLLLYGRDTGYYMFPFEIASILLLVAVVGAVVMAKRRV
jgi:ferredoxin